MENWEEQAFAGRLGVQLCVNFEMSGSHTRGDAESCSVLHRHLSLSSLEFSGEVIARKEYLGVVSKQMVFKFKRLEIVTAGVNINR